MPAKNFIRKNIYRWHRVTSLIVALPILLWSLSGFLHPVMNSFKPQVRNQYLPSTAIDTALIKFSLLDALRRNKISELHHFRIVKLDSSYYYQLRLPGTDILNYLSCTDGNVLKEGDRLYAAYLAQRYLSEPIKKEKQSGSHGHQLAADIGFVTANFNSQKSYVKSRIKSVALVNAFDREYKSSNVLLPVYKVRFDRNDNIRLYIETSTDRLAAAIDEKKAWFIWFFGITHSWNFLDGMGKTKQLVLGIFSLLCFITSILGFYVYNIIGKKKTSSTGKSWHRSLGNLFVLTTALYGLSGAWHALHKLSDHTEQTGKAFSAYQTPFSSQESALSLPALLKPLHHIGKISDISAVRMYGENYWQLSVSDGKVSYKKYISAKTGKELMHGDAAYGRYLASLYSVNSPDAITHSAPVTKFTNSYSMKYKRLPVTEVRFGNSENYYVETSTGRLAAVTNPYDKAERFSFSNLHMHHYWEHWLGERGKTIQKTLLISSTVGLLLLAFTGCWVYWKKTRRSKKAVQQK